MTLHERLIAHTSCIPALKTAEGSLLSSRHTLLSILQTQTVQSQQASMNSWGEQIVDKIALLSKTKDCTGSRGGKFPTTSILEALHVQVRIFCIFVNFIFPDIIVDYHFPIRPAWVHWPIEQLRTINRIPWHPWTNINISLIPLEWAGAIAHQCWQFESLTDLREDASWCYVSSVSGRLSNNGSLNAWSHFVHTKNRIILVSLRFDWSW